MANGHETISSFLAGERDAETAFLAELVKVPSDNPAGDCDAHAERAASLLEALGFEVERPRTAWSAPPTWWCAGATGTGR
jgi:hypothetical protein